MCGIRVFVDDCREPLMAGCYADPADKWVIARDYDEAIEIFSTREVREVSLDHDLGDPNGRDGTALAKWLTANKKWPAEVRFHSANPVGRQRMEDEYHFYLSAVKRGLL